MKMSSNVFSTEEPLPRQPDQDKMKKTKNTKTKPRRLFQYCQLWEQKFSRYFVRYWEFLRHLKIFM